MSAERTCQNCNHWNPRYRGVGQCTAEGKPNAKLWVTENKELLTIASFSCQAFAEKEALEKQVL